MTRRQHQKPAVPVLSQNRDWPTQSSVPTHWSPEQASAVFEMVDALREEIWGLYGLQIQRVLRKDRVTTNPFTPNDIDENDVPF